MNRSYRRLTGRGGDLSRFVDFTAGETKLHFMDREFSDPKGDASLH